MTNELQKEEIKIKLLTQDDLYFQLVSVHILAVSILEFSLKNKEINEIQCQKTKRIKFENIINYIKQSQILDDMQKDWLILLVLIRHTLVHNYGHIDQDFRCGVNKYIEKLKYEFPNDKSQLATLSPDDVAICIKLLKRYIYLDIMSEHLKNGWKKVLDKELNIVKYPIKELVIYYLRSNSERTHQTPLVLRNCGIAVYPLVI